MDFAKAQAALAALNLPTACMQELTATLSRHEKRAGKAKAKAAGAAAVQAKAGELLEALTAICTALNAPVQLATVGQRVGLSNRIPAERSLLLKCMRHLQSTGQVEQVGWKGGSLQPIESVNNFQRRWMPAGLELK